MRVEIQLLILAAAIWISGCAVSAEKGDSQDGRPNIVIILADDLGYSDIGCYGGEISTPSIDALAKNGLRFTQFYNNARCCPSRASLLTGLYPHLAGVGAMTHDNKSPGYRGYLTENTVTIAEVLRQAGYHTGMVGKWHVSQTAELPKEQQLKWLAHQIEKPEFSPVSQYPVSRGFEKYYGNLWGVVDYFDPFSLVNGSKPVKSVPENYYYTTAIGDSAVAYVDEFTRDEKPFFLYIAHTAPHWPLHALEEDIRKYEDTYKPGWEVIRRKRYEKMLSLGLFDEKTAPLSPWMFPERTWEKNPNKEFDARAMAVHAAMIDRMDQTIGKLVKKLQEKGELDNTLILFLSDNGTSSERPSRYGPGFDRAGSTRTGQTVAFPVDKTSLPGSQTVMAGIGPEWASVGSTPFRYFKAKLHEGGMATPLIVHWPEKLTNRGGISRHRAHVMDIMATCLDVAGTSYPDTFNRRAITPTTGRSFLGALLNVNETQKQHEVIFWEHLGAAALRNSDWKLVRVGMKADWELYNMANDKTEVNNLAARYPEKVKEMALVWEKMAGEQNVFPSPVNH
jgi:arylsulfatase A-like enzyme